MLLLVAESIKNGQNMGTAILWKSAELSTDIFSTGLDDFVSYRTI